MYSYLNKYQIFRIFNEYVSHIPKKRNKLIIFSFALIFITGFFELINVASLLPVLKSFTASEDLNNLQIYNFIFQLFNINTNNSKIICTTLIFIFLILISNTIKILTFYLNARIAAVIGSDLCSKVYQNAICQPYYYHLSKNTNDIISNIITGSQIIVSVVNTVLRSVLSIITFIFVLIALFWINGKIAIFSLTIFSLIYIIIMFYFKTILKNKSAKIYKINVKIVKLIQESFGNIKDIILDNSQNFFIKDYRQVDLIKRKQEAEIDLLGRLPFYFIEALALISIVLIGLFLAVYLNDSYILPILGSIGLGLQRLLRSFQELYQGWVFVQGRIKILTSFLLYLNLKTNKYLLFSDKERFDFQKSIILKNVFFKYNENLILENFNLEINKGKIIGIKGRTGRGKSTLINLIMGLLIPTKGEVLVDGVNINAVQNERIKMKYFNSISHVSQDIYLSNLSFAENIAFGVPYEQIDINRVKNAAKKAFIYDFINSTIDAFRTTVGERGINLSGGQKQRIGIARALYKGSTILILDEATSSLDYHTEELVIKNIQSNDNCLTVIMIAHRLSTLDKCDLIIEL
ncbi:ATPase [Prochlorococcus marinus str. MIT 9312]|uniref:ATPase n=1 Tax=Prochlorococcus marinus (strain MIT 9312) TaxID=74546 RepID=Q319Q3_PROM9|nr:ABC transporter ATP-binding protein [Prochlorococcus marinus]ABB50392.1 ATPase [Prochlorococcus marinus str. MIT 9312]KGF99986.1 Phospholipid-lipopolysaccharide ABC transporter [Prochlorococcus marinus str. MIT 9311]